LFWLEGLELDYKQSLYLYKKRIYVMSVMQENNLSPVSFNANLSQTCFTISQTELSIFIDWNKEPLAL